MPPKNNNNNKPKNKKNHQQPPNNNVPQFGSTKGRHVKTNPFINDFACKMDKDVSATSLKVKKAGKFMSRAQRLAANAKAKNKGKAE